MTSTLNNLPDPKYGPELEEYLEKAGYKRPRELAPTLTEAHIADAVNSLAEPERVTYRTFETLMALEWNPVCNHIGLVLGDSRVYPLCIKLLHLVHDDDRAILDSAYGFMCLQFMALALEIAKIAQNDRLGAFKEDISKLSPNRSIRSILNNYARELEGEGIWCNLGNVDKFTHYLGWDWGEDRYRSCLPQVGGCGFKDTMFLLEKLWTERHLFLKAAQVAAGIFPGWGGLVYVIWHSTLENLGGDGGPSVLVELTRKHAPRERAWTRMFEIALRYAMCSETHEDPLMYVTINSDSLRKSLTKPDKYDAVDDEDAIYVAACTTRKLRSLSTINDMNVMAAELLGYASMLLRPTDFEFHVDQLYKAAFERAWNEVSAVHRMDSFRWYTFGINLNIMIAALNRLWEKHATRPESAIALRDLALDWNFYELYAYSLLFPLSQMGRSINATEKLPDYHEYEIGLQLVVLRKAIMTLEVLVDPTYTFFSDWDKITNHIAFLHDVLRESRESNGVCTDGLWDGATLIYPYEDYVSTTPEFQCGLVEHI